MFSNYSPADFLRTANETLGQLGLPGLFGSEGIDNLRGISWGKKYLWAVTFLEPKAPTPFESFFPASDIEITDSLIESFVFEQGQSTFRAPQKTNARQVSITFYDDIDGTLFKWMSDWINLDILNNGKYVSCLLDDHKPEGDRLVNFQQGNRVWPVRKIQFCKLGNGLDPIKGTEQILTVYPEGELQLSGSSGSEACVFTVAFNIVGDDRTAKDTGSTDILQKAKKEATRLLGRFI